MLTYTTKYLLLCIKYVMQFRCIILYVCCYSLNVLTNLAAVISLDVISVIYIVELYYDNSVV